MCRDKQIAAVLAAVQPGHGLCRQLTHAVEQDRQDIPANGRQGLNSAPGPTLAVQHAKQSAQQSRQPTRLQAATAVPCSPVASEVQLSARIRWGVCWPWPLTQIASAPSRAPHPTHPHPPPHTPPPAPPSASHVSVGVQAGRQLALPVPHLLNLLLSQGGVCGDSGNSAPVLLGAPAPWKALPACAALLRCAWRRAGSECTGGACTKKLRTERE